MENKKHRLGRLGICYIVGIGFLLVTNPEKLPSVLLIVPPILLFLAVFFTVLEISSLMNGKEEEKANGILPVRRPRIMAGLIAGLPVMLLVLQSIGQLTFWDVVTVIAIFSIACLYVLRSSAVFPGR